MSDDKKSELIDACTAFTVHGACKTLCEFQQLQGLVNWSLNAFPLLHLALCKSYKKVSGKV
jgi:hypothetical protein